jgi:hypothetical protein
MIPNILRDAIRAAPGSVYSPDGKRFRPNEASRQSPLFLVFKLENIPFAFLLGNTYSVFETIQAQVALL